MVTERLRQLEGCGVSPLFFLVYREELAGGREVFAARSVGTGHVAMGTSRERALECLRRTVRASLQAAHESGVSFDDWLGAQLPDDPRFIHLYLTTAQEQGVTMLPCDDKRVAMVGTV